MFQLYQQEQLSYDSNIVEYSFKAFVECSSDRQGVSEHLMHHHH